MKKGIYKLTFLLVCLFSVQLWAQTTDEVFTKTLITKGDYDSEWWRIPAITTAGDGSLVTVFDKRGASSGDLPNTITLVSMRSEDNGRTWSEPVVVAQGGNGKTYGDAALLLDTVTNDIFCLYVGDRGFFESTATNRAVIYYSKSSDHGKSWSAPVSLNDFIYRDSRSGWKAAFVASGTGLQLSTGRLMFVMCVRPADDNNDGFVDNWVLYSDDHGETWKVSENRATDVGNESKLVELDNGDVLMSIRNHSKGYRRFCKSTDGGITWGTSYLSDDLKDTDCNGDIIRYCYGGHNYLIHSLPNSASERVNVSVFLSDDEGETWPIYRQLVTGNSAYSSLTVLPNGTIGCLIEEGGYEGFNIVFHNFTIDWLLNGQSNGALIVDGYRIPEGTMHSGGNAYVSRIYTENATTNIDKSYSSTPDNVYQLLSETIQVVPGQSFNLHLVANDLGTPTTVKQDLRYNTAVIFADWEGDGKFTQVASYGDIFSGANTVANYNVVMNINQQLTVPATAETGRARIRVIYQNAWKGLPSANAINIYEGMAYDIPVRIGEEGGGTTPVTYCGSTWGNAGSKYSRHLNSLVLTGGIDETTTISGFEHTNDHAVYNDCTNEVFRANAGSTISLQPTSDEVVAWVHGYIYIDYNGDGQFSYDIDTSTGLINEGSELVSYSYYGVNDATTNRGFDSTGKAYVGESSANRAGSLVETGRIPSFTLPDNLATGNYRMRFKMDWNSLDPCGNSASNNLITDSGGYIIDFTLQVDDSNSIAEVSGEDVQLYCANGYIYTNTEGEIAIYDLAGKLVRCANVAPVAIYDLANGVYMVKVNGKSMKFVK